MSEIIGEGEALRFFEVATAVRLDLPDGGWGIELDGRVVKTPMSKTFLVPSSALAEAVVNEWSAQGEKIIPATMPLTGLANAATDRIEPNPQFFIDQLVTYARSDLLCYWAEGPEDLVVRQHIAWQPILDWVNETFNARFVTATGIIPVEQPEESLKAIKDALQDASVFHLAGLIDLAGIKSSVLLALAVWNGRLTPEDAFDAAFVDEIFQEEQWGEDHDAIQRRSVIRSEVIATANFLQLLDVA
ncbi:MAG: ATPase [Rhodospirillales bacterium]|nr:ATPase [Rhodospirillales bacterium]